VEAITRVTVNLYTCQRPQCGHSWLPRHPDDPVPGTCPKCKSAYWARPRDEEGKLVKRAS
jgi:hypothetical protein